MRPVATERLVFAAALCAASPACAADLGFVYVYADVTNDYRFEGISSSAREPSEQLGLHWGAPDNFYAGVLVSMVRFHDYRGTHYETDFYGGRHFFFDNNDLNLEVLYFAYPDSAGHPSYAPHGVIYPTYDAFETSAALTHSFRALQLSGKVVWSPSYGSHTGASWEIDGGAAYWIAPWLSANANLGRQWISRFVDRTHFDAGATVDWPSPKSPQQWSLDLRYYATDQGPAHCYSTNWCAAAFVAKVTYGIAL